jgi:hypothetical protein
MQEQTILQFMPEVMPYIQVMTILSAIQVVREIAHLNCSERKKYTVVKCQCQQIIRARTAVIHMIPKNIKMKYIVSFYIPELYRYLLKGKMYFQMRG